MYSFYTRIDPYVRPLGYFFSTIIMIVLLANEILYLPLKKTRIYFVLFKIMLIGISLSFSQGLLFPDVVGVDPWVHRWYTLKIIENAFIPNIGGFSYDKIPFLHLMIGTTSIITNLEYKISSMISITLIQIISDTLIIFLLGKYLSSIKVGLLAALLLVIANHHIYFGFVAIPTTMGAILMLPIIFILLKFRKDKSFLGVFVAIFLMASLILTHTVTSMCLAILLFVFCSSYEIYDRLYHYENVGSITWTVCFLFSIGMIFYWSNYSMHLSTLVQLILQGFQGKTSYESYQFLPGIQLREQLLGYLGLFLFFSISFLGCLFMVSKEYRNKSRFVYVIGGVTILFIGFISLISNTDLIVGRWIYYSQILMAFPLSLSLLLITSVSNPRIFRSLFLSFSMILLSFFLILSPISNLDNNLLYPNRGNRYAFTRSELDAMDVINDFWVYSTGARLLASDRQRFQSFKFNLKIFMQYSTLDEILTSENQTGNEYILILVRDEVLKHKYPSGSNSGGKELDYMNEFNGINFERIFDNGSTISFSN